MAARRLIEGLKSPWSLAFSGFGAAYGLYYVIDTTQAGEKYEPELDLTGKTYIVTGATSGIGQALTEDLAKRNARVIMACRNREKCVQVRRDIVLSTRNKQVYCRQCDLSDFESIKTFVSRLSTGNYALDRIDGVVNNAATMSAKRKVVPTNGIEESFATNHFGTFLLTALMLDKLLAQDHPVRLVFLNTNVINRKCELDFEDLNADKREKYDGYEVYKQSKLAQAMFAKELAHRLKDSNISVFLADPGRTKTALDQKLNHQDFFLSRWLLAPVGFLMGQRKPDKAIKPVLYALADPEAEPLAGSFIDRDRKEQALGEIVEDDAQRAKLWAISEAWTRLPEFSGKLKLELGQTAAPAVLEAGEAVEAAAGRKWYWPF